MGVPHAEALMTSTLLVLLRFSQAERSDTPSAGALEPALPASLAGRWHHVAFASMDLGVDDAR